ncbi:phosphotransferase family protein [Halieaceae bacterium IMCC14734]|uniref:Phosphotransferase family protein n=1 Tax=Candidatus Litorirhabdus singularis TaxID=2518993 RepID=A0ABT3TCE7_9GAMM|nr:phosphotransferase family protein [Candidatus Litorirhabdus singularis]MCX2979505.1 phosphotransferase family protein [Candidatus Litorirhabdus singularis]
MKDERPTPLLENPQLTQQKLAAWFSQRKGTQVKVSEFHIPEATGMSNVTLLFDIHWQEGGITLTEPCVGRLQPEIERPVFPAYDLSLQYRVMKTLNENTDIPAPDMRGLEMDTSILGVPFYIMKKTEGRIPTDMPPYNMDGWMMHETSLQQRENLWFAGIDTMARFHKLDHESLGFADMNQPELGDTPLQQQLSYWENYLEWGMEGRGHPLAQSALQWLRDNQPSNEITKLCWGDSRLANLIFTEDCSAVAAVLDWEMAVLGNPMQDLAWYCYIDSSFADGLGLERLEGLPSYAATVERWHSVTGYPVDDYDYYRLFAAMRYGLILSRIMVAQDQESEIHSNFACQLLQRTLQEVAAIG